MTLLAIAIKVHGKGGMAYWQLANKALNHSDVSPIYMKGLETYCNSRGYGRSTGVGAALSGRGMQHLRPKILYYRAVLLMML